MLRGPPTPLPNSSITSQLVDELGGLNKERFNNLSLGNLNRWINK
jgi:hypothetical protein